MAKIKEVFCVITGDVNTANGCPRTWKDTQIEAADHAQALIEKSRNSSGNGYHTKRLLVVKVVEVVEVQGPPIIRRAPRSGDLPGSEGD